MSNDFKNPWENMEKEIEKRRKSVDDNNDDLDEENKKNVAGNCSFVNFSNNSTGSSKNQNGKRSAGLPPNLFGIFKFKNFILIVFLFVIVWLLSGIYKIDANQEGVVLYFGKFYKISGPGLNYFIPAPIGKIYKISVTNINKEEFGFRSERSGNKNINAESLMLTGDENIVDIDYEVQWRIKDAKNFLFSLEKPKATIRIATESAMREIIAKRKIDDALASKKSAIESEVLALLQEILDSYESGIEIVLVQLLRVDPPAEVIDAFRDVQTARADKERKINEAETYRNDVIPKARGEAESLIKEAEGYKESLIYNAEGEVASFLRVYKEYRNNPSLTKRRIYLETMDEIMKNINKTIVDENISKNTLQHLKLNN